MVDVGFYTFKYNLLFKRDLHQKFWSVLKIIIGSEMVLRGSKLVHLKQFFNLSAI